MAGTVFVIGAMRQMAGLSERIGSAVVISSITVYGDERGRGSVIQEEPDGFPPHPAPVPETQRTVPAGDRGYSTLKAALERELTAAGDAPPTALLRAGAVHGPRSRLPRELYFVKRALDKRPVRVPAYRGESRFHTSHSANTAELVPLAARRPWSRVLNAADPYPPTVAETGSAIDPVLDHVCETVPLDGPATQRNSCQGHLKPPRITRTWPNTDRPVIRTMGPSSSCGPLPPGSERLPNSAVPVS